MIIKKKIKLYGIFNQGEMIVLDKYTLMFKDLPIGDFIYNDKEDRFSFKLYDAVDNLVNIN